MNSEESKIEEELGSPSLNTNTQTVIYEEKQEVESYCTCEVRSVRMLRCDGGQSSQSKRLID